MLKFHAVACYRGTVFLYRFRAEAGRAYNMLNSTYALLRYLKLQITVDNNITSYDIEYMASEDFNFFPTNARQRCFVRDFIGDDACPSILLFRKQPR